MFEKLKFWKKEPEFDFDKLSGQLSTQPDPFGVGQAPPAADQLGLGMDRTAGLAGTGPLEESRPSYSGGEFGSDVIRGKQGYVRELPTQQRFGSSSAGGDVLAKDMEIISSKLDAIKAMVESVNQRLEQMERQGRDAYKRW